MAQALSGSVCLTVVCGETMAPYFEAGGKCFLAVDGLEALLAKDLDDYEKNVIRTNLVIAENELHAGSKALFTAVKRKFSQAVREAYDYLNARNLLNASNAKYSECEPWQQVWIQLIKQPGRPDMYCIWVTKGKAKSAQRKSAAEQQQVRISAQQLFLPNALQLVQSKALPLSQHEPNAPHQQAQISAEQWLTLNAPPKEPLEWPVLEKCELGNLCSCCKTKQVNVRLVRAPASQNQHIICLECLREQVKGKKGIRYVRFDGAAV